MYKLAFSTLGCPAYTVGQVIDAAVRYGFDGISLRTIEGTTELEKLEAFRPVRIGATAGQFREAGVDVLCVSSGVRFTSSDAEERAGQLATARRYIDMASALEAPFIRIFAGPVTEKMDPAAVEDQVVEGFRSVGEYAVANGVTALMETHDTFSTGASVKPLLDRVDHPGIAVVWDILHSLRFGEGFEETWNLIGDRIRNIHIKDSRKFGPDGFDLVLCGDGHVAIGDAVGVARSRGYDGYLEFEWEKAWHAEISEPEIAFPHFVEYMKSMV